MTSGKHNKQTKPILTNLHNISLLPIFSSFDQSHRDNELLQSYRGYESRKRDSNHLNGWRVLHTHDAQWCLHVCLHQRKRKCGFNTPLFAWIHQGHALILRGRAQWGDSQIKFLIDLRASRRGNGLWLPIAPRCQSAQRIHPYRKVKTGANRYRKTESNHDIGDGSDLLESRRHSL